MQYKKMSRTYSREIFKELLPVNNSAKLWTEWIMKQNKIKSTITTAQWWANVFKGLKTSWQLCEEIEEMNKKSLKINITLNSEKRKNITENI